MSYGNWTPKSPCDLVERFNAGVAHYLPPPPPPISIRYQLLEALTKPKDELHPELRDIIPNNKADLPDVSIQRFEEEYCNHGYTRTLRKEVELMSSTVAKANRHLTSSAIYVNQVTYNDLMQWGKSTYPEHKATYGTC